MPVRQSVSWNQIGKRLLVGLVLIWLACARLVAAGQAAGRHGDVPPQFTLEPCPVPLPGGMTEGVDITCGKVCVPEFHDEPDGRRIDLAVAVVKARSPSPLPEPIVWLEGGPGGPALEGLPHLPEFLYANRDLIVFDQRGAGHSVPALECPEVEDPMWEVLSVDEQEQAWTDALLRCFRRLRSEGVNLGAFSTHESAQDVIDVARALGYGQVVLYGSSYGTRLGLTVLGLFPDCCRSAVLDGVSPPELSWARDKAQNAQASLSEVFRACAEDDECARAFPHLRDDFERLIERLDENPLDLCSYTSPGARCPLSIGGADVVEGLSRRLHAGFPVSIMPAVLSQAAQGDHALLAEIVVPAIGYGRRGLTVGMFYAITCSDEGPETGWPECADWPPGGAHMHRPTAAGPVSSDIPVLLLNGRFDVVTPPRYGEAAARTLSQSTLVTFPNAGHGVIGSSECADRVIAQFLADPEADLDLSCVHALSDLDFVVPSEVIPVSLLAVGARYRQLWGWLRLYLVPGGATTLASAIPAAVVVHPLVRRLRSTPRVARLLERWDRLRQKGWLCRSRRAASVSAALLAPLLLLFGWFVPLGRRVRKKWKRWERREQRAIPRLARRVPGMAALLGALTVGVVLVAVLLLFTGWWYHFLLLGLPRSMLWLIVLPWCYVVVAALLTAGTILGILSPKWSRLRKIYYTLAAGSALMESGALAFVGLLTPPL
ncbi:MAG: alpha/beta hydrolase [Chloroflexota bacterium]